MLAQVQTYCRPDWPFTWMTPSLGIFASGLVVGFIVHAFIMRWKS